MAAPVVSPFPVFRRLQPWNPFRNPLFWARRFGTSEHSEATDRVSNEWHKQVLPRYRLGLRAEAVSACSGENSRR